jgi:cobalamin synthase
MSTSQYSGNGQRSQAAVFIVMLVLSMTAGFVLAGKYGFVILGCVAGYALAQVRAYRSLKGVNGDVAGYSLTIGELCSLIVMALL